MAPATNPYPSATPVGGSASSTFAPGHTPQNKRQGRALRPNLLARMGLCPRLPELKAARPGTALLLAPLQLASPSCQYQRQATHQQTRPGRGQPVEAPQLERLRHKKVVSDDRP